MPAWMKQSVTVYFTVLSLFSALLLSAMYVIFILLWNQLLVAYKTEYLDDQTLKMTFAIQEKVKHEPLIENQLMWIYSLSKQYSGFVKYTDPTGDKVWLDSSLQQEPLVTPYEVELPLMIEGQLAGLLTASYDLSNDNYFPYFTNMNNTAKKQARIVYIGLLLIAILLSLWISVMMTKQLRLKAKRAYTIMNGDHETEIPAGGIFEHTQMAQTINYLLAEFKQQEKWRKQLMQDLTHELRTPLTSVLSRLEAMIDGIYPLTERNMNLIYAEIDRLSRLVKDVEKLSEAEGARFTLNLQRVDMVQLLRSVHEGFLFLAHDKDIAFTTQPVYVPIYAEVDPDRLIQVISNVISNAIKYTPVGGEIDIVLRTDDYETAIYVTDKGMGISPEDLPYIFNRFYRADKSRSRDSGGLGVGLSIARVLVEAHGGTMEVESELGIGSTFTIRLPIMSKSDRQEPEALAE
ncbi:sensor histidine kinase [Paenibacillus mendelii]|uniref:histidine kinase n=1 Tax=Paenibacillus mendelii TaxID=206163 RepID=A0ABV6JJP7_9BACL|nr:ATP-binding protein [Paenibacillus mendelii]MCQ6559075.1 cell wall metabolism sensor histidine kinase WalK [Paenibacillus mendelii]